MHLLGFHDNFTTNTSLTRVRAVPRYSFSIETLEALNKMCPTIGIMPSGLPWVKKGLRKSERLSDSFFTSPYKRGRWSANGEVQSDQQAVNEGPVERFHEYMYSVPYSDHSNFTEIKEFIKLVRPTNLKGIVASSSCYIEPMYYLGRLCGVNQPAQKLHSKHKSKGGVERAETVSNKTSFRNGNFVESERRRGKTLKINSIGFRLSRLSRLRRTGRGAKIVEDNSPDQS